VERSKKRDRQKPGEERCLTYQEKSGTEKKDFKTPCNLLGFSTDCWFGDKRQSVIEAGGGRIFIRAENFEINISSTPGKGEGKSQKKGERGKKINNV